MLGSFKIDVLQITQFDDGDNKYIEDIFQGATKRLLGVGRELMLYLGNQTVNGANYAYISRSVPAALDPRPYYELITINKNGNKKPFIVKTEHIIQNAEYLTMGGIICSQSHEAPIRIIDSIEANHLMTLFNEAIKKTKDMKEESDIVEKVKKFDYEAELYLGHKIVKGCNYYYIAQATNIETKEKTIQLVVINNFIDGAKVVEIKDIL